MDAGLVVVLAVTGVVLLVPLVFAWVSTNPRRWARVERVLGREPRREVRWAPWFWVVAGAVYVVMGIVRVRGDRPDVGWVAVVMGAMYLAIGVAAFLLRARVRRERSSQTQVQDRAEPGRPGAGG
jgi:heme A synthase